ncbi:MAG TPA: ribokinase [Acetobacteraceae bacterium]|nr:ribokinase [Acetobacteraceae bacterium]
MVVVFGSINLDIVFPVPALPRPGETVLGPGAQMHPGGKGANQALAAARDGAVVCLAGAVGRDALAEAALALLGAAGVDLSRVVRHDTMTGCAGICVDTAGRNQIAVASGANLFARATQVEDALLARGHTLVLQMECDAGESAALIARARAGGARVMLNLAPALPMPRATLEAVDVVVVNEEEAAVVASGFGVAPEAASLHAALGPAVVVTRGAEGLVCASAAGEVVLPARTVSVVDTTGAGDCFCGVLAAALDRGLPLGAALERAGVAASLSCTRAGAQTSFPVTGEINAAG